LIATEDLSGMLKQVPQQVELDRSQMDLLAVAGDPMGVEPHFEVAIAELLDRNPTIGLGGLSLSGWERVCAIRRCHL
ncbi:hypothetical protein, partial [Mesorhizobium sp. M00.F.Ca.ET.216.01.1.1]|uniref:hypothetical protein n=1 Tax=Mesorhizobium sp. M00.F.Ca.ET.216.01.1.1 TaxID=2500528 RepID=UPI001FE21EE0